jgi:metal-responsive CopG/Arc/MetJ family transcriptional regulator
MLCFMDYITKYYIIGSQSLRVRGVTNVMGLVQKNRHRVNTGISFPRPLLELVDARRGDVPRTRYIQRILERYITEQGNENKNVSSSTSPNASEVGRHEERQASAELVPSVVKNNTYNDEIQEYL